MKNTLEKSKPRHVTGQTKGRKVLAGRFKSGKKKVSTARIDFRVKPEEKKDLLKAAEILGYKNLSAYMGDIVLANAYHIISEHQGILTTDKARDIFFRAIENPPTPNKALRDVVLELSLSTQNKRG